MSYTKLTDFASKDALLTGNPSKLVRGTELGAEFDAIEVADALNIKPDTVTAATGKTTPVDADLLTLFDSASTFSLKKLTWANLKATLKTYFDTLYAVKGANGDITSLTALTSISGNPAFSGAPTSTTPAASDATTKLATMAAVNSTGRVVQTVEATPYVTYTSTAVALPYDDTIPQNTEGLELITVTITPKSASNRLRIEFDASMNASTSVGKISVALFQDSTASAIAAQGGWGGDNTIQYKAGIVHEMAAGTTSATTFKIRFGADAGTAYVNGTNATRRFGGVQAARLKVTELAA